MSRMISFPFRIGADGRVVTIDSDSSDATAQRLAQLAATMEGERPLQPKFGTPDSEWGKFPVNQYKLRVAMFGPFGVNVAVASEYLNDAAAKVTISFAENGRP